MTVGIYN